MPRSRKLLHYCALAMFAISSGIASRAADLLDNTSQGTSSLSSSSLLGQEIRSGVVFETGATAYSLTAIKLGLLNTQAQTITFDLSLYQADSNGDPTGAALATLNVNQSFSASTAYYDFSPTGFNIGTSQKYILLIENAVFSGTLGWALNFAGSAPVASGGLTYAGYRRFDGSSWSTNPNFGTIWLQGTAVPEPSTYVLWGMSGLTLTLSGRRFRNRA